MAGGIAGPIVARGDLIEESAWLEMARQDMVGGDQVIVVAVGQRAHEGKAVRPGREAGQVLANPQPGDPGGDGPERAPNLGGGVRLYIEGIKVTGSAAEEYQDD